MTGAPLHIGYLLDKYGASSQTFVTDEIDELRRQGVDVSIVTVAGPPGPDGLTLQPGGPSRSELLRSHLSWLLRSPVRYWRFRAAVASVASEMHSGPAPHAQSVPWKHLPYVATWLSARGVRQLHAHFAWSGAAAAHCLSALTGWPWSLTVHANDLFSHTRNLAPKLASTSLVVTVCEYNVDYLRSQLGYRGRIELVVCGVEDVTTESELETPPGADPSYDIVTVGRLVPKKGFDLLISAVAVLVTSHPAPRVLIVGDGKLRAALEDQASALGLSSVITFAGELSHRSTLAAIGTASVFCLPARIDISGDRDSMPVVIKEAMVHSVPIVATAVVGIPEMLDPSYSRMVPGEDVEALASALAAELALTPSARAARGALARSAALSRFSLNHWVSVLRGHLSSLQR